MNDNTLTFREPGMAFMWADEFASRPDAKSPTQLLIRALKETPRSPWAISPEDLMDQALTILQAISRLDPWVAKAAFKSVWGLAEEERDAELASRIAQHCHDRTGKEYSRCARLAHITIMATRLRNQYGQRVPITWYARAIGIRRQSLKKGWLNVIQLSEAQLAEWTAQGYRQAWVQLGECGAIDRDTYASHQLINGRPGEFNRIKMTGGTRE